MKKIKIGIVGYGNIGRGVLAAIKQNSDMELAGIFTRRDPKVVATQVSEDMERTQVDEGMQAHIENIKVFPIEELRKKTETGMLHDIDVLIMCGGSATDLPQQSPEFAGLYNIVDSFDNHSRMPEHFKALDEAARAGKKVATMAVGWDPGLFSLNRAIALAAMPRGETYTFWGKGISQGHSDAIRRIDGVKDARQYTIPLREALERVRSGETPALSAREMHTRECFVVAGAQAHQVATDMPVDQVAKDARDDPSASVERARIENEIITMPAYFADYDTTVHFISAEELKEEHKGLPHGGAVIRSGQTGFHEENTAVYELKLKLDSNPEFCAGVLMAYARATYRMAKEGVAGCKTIFDIPISYASTLTPEELRKTLL